jgi:hypothetical protein
MNSAAAPVVRGLYVCERVEKNLVTRNLTLHNCFRVLKVAVPGLARKFYVVAYLANGFGEVSCEAVITRGDTLDEVFVSKGTVTFADRLDEQRYILEVSLQFPVVGRYDIILSVNGEAVAVSPLFIKPL